MEPPASRDDASPETAYARRLQAHQEEKGKQLRRQHWLTRGKRVLLGVIVVLAMLVEKEKGAVMVAILVGPAVLGDVLMALRRRAVRARFHAIRAARYCEDRLACLAGDWAGRGEPGTRYLEADHPAALDLDLFGTGSLFELICTARSRPGQDTLAAWLLAPAGVDEVKARQEAVAELRPRLNFREDLAERGAAVPGRGPLAALARWGEETVPPLPRPVRWVAFAVPPCTLVAVIGWVIVGTSFGFVIAAGLVQAGLAWWLHGYAERILGGAEAGRPGLLPLGDILARLGRERFAAPRLRSLVASAQSGDRPAPKRLKRLDRILNRAIPATLFGCRPQLAFRVDAWRRKQGRNLVRWLEALGEIEALCALATHAHENPQSVFPEVVHAGPCFEAERLGHPLLAPDRCVPNDVTLGGELRLLIVSGSNMSGKSTLLRTVGINVALALAGAPVRAVRLRLSPLAVGATLRVQDSLQAGRSRFYAEALRVRQLLDMAAGPVPLLFLLDELFQGTNSQDRRVGAEAVLRRLLERGAVGLITTHDLALTVLADLLPRAVNVHFEDRFADGAMSFDYRLKPGVVPTSNGLALLRAVGIEV